MFRRVKDKANLAKVRCRSVLQDQCEFVVLAQSAHHLLRGPGHSVHLEDAVALPDAGFAPINLVPIFHEAIPGDALDNERLRFAIFVVLWGSQSDTQSRAFFWLLQRDLEL